MQKDLNQPTFICLLSKGPELKSVQANCSSLLHESP